jgi:Transposase DDE domain group 1
VIAKIEHHLGELFPRVGFIVTTLSGTNRAVVRFYNQRGTAEQWIKEGKQAVKMTRLSCHRFRSNQVRLALSLLAYNLGNLWLSLVLTKGSGACFVLSLCDPKCSQVICRSFSQRA